MTQAEWVRDTLDNASRGAKPPNDAETLAIQTDKERVAKWVKMAESTFKPDESLPLSEWVGQLLDSLYIRRFPNESEVDDE
jgi:hypothetical protein